jgi:hypothetical protein
VLVDVAPQMRPAGVEMISGFMLEHLDEGFVSLKEAAEIIAAYQPHRRRPSSVEGLERNLRRERDGRYRWHWDPSFVIGNTELIEIHTSTK